MKVREGQPHGVTTHARRAAELFARVRDEVGRHVLGLDLDLDRYATLARGLAEAPPIDPGTRDARVTRVFEFRIEPRDQDAR